jgi:hypothetical protein
MEQYLNEQAHMWNVPIDVASFLPPYKDTLQSSILLFVNEFVSNRDHIKNSNKVCL